MAIYYESELYHHGIKGQRWGVRRYQNKDGSLTPAGKKKYYKSDGSLTKAGQKHAYGMTKRQFRKRLKESTSDDNYRKVRDEHYNALINNKEFMTASKKSTALAEKVMKAELDLLDEHPDGDYDFPKSLKNDIEQMRKESAKADAVAAKIGKSFVGKYEQASVKDTLKNVDFKGSEELGKRMIKEYSKKRRFDFGPGYDINAEIDVAGDYKFIYDRNL